MHWTGSKDRPRLPGQRAEGKVGHSAPDWPDIIEEIGGADRVAGRWQRALTLRASANGPPRSPISAFCPVTL